MIELEKSKYSDDNISKIALLWTHLIQCKEQNYLKMATNMRRENVEKILSVETNGSNVLE